MQWSGLHHTIRKQRIVFRAVTCLVGRSCVAGNELSPHCRHDYQTSRNYVAQAVPQNYYDLLGIKHDASMVQVKAAYYRLSKEFHPDMNKSDDAHTAFQQILEAYEVLGNKRRRTLYDQGIFVRKARGTVQRDTSTRKDIRSTRQFHKRQNTPELGQTDIYNFEEFYRMHYGASIHNKQQIRNARDRSDEEFRNLIFSKNVLRVTLFLGLLFAAVTAYTHNQI